MFSHQSRGKSLSSLNMAPSKRGCPPAGKTSLPGHAVPPERDGWVGVNRSELFTSFPWPVNHRLGNPNRGTVYTHNAEKQAAVSRLTFELPPKRVYGSFTSQLASCGPKNPNRSMVQRGGCRSPRQLSETGSDWGTGLAPPEKRLFSSPGSFAFEDGFSPCSKQANMPPRAQQVSFLMLSVVVKQDGVWT